MDGKTLEFSRKTIYFDSLCLPGIQPPNTRSYIATTWPGIYYVHVNNYPTYDVLCVSHYVTLAMFFLRTGCFCIHSRNLCNRITWEIPLINDNDNH